MEPRIEIEANGPYLVHGVALTRTAQVETEFGEPVDWAPDEEIVAGEPLEVCRCGRSASMPLCDREACRDGFDGAETAPRAPRAERAYPYKGDGFTMTDNQTLCTQAGYCGDRFRNVWAMLGDSDDPEVREHLRTMVQLCPSGRIEYVPEGAEEPDELDLGRRVAAVVDGPLWVRGKVPVVSADGTAYEARNRVTLCRCGHSDNKPLCDGTHKEVGFTDG